MIDEWKWEEIFNELDGQTAIDGYERC